MIVENGKIIEATRRELYCRWIGDDWDEFVTFPDYLMHLERAGVKIVEEEPMNDRERMIKLIQDAVGGCARHWAALIADKLIDSGFGLVKKTPIESLDLSVRTYNAVKRAGINTVEELRSWDKALLARCRGVGETAIKEIESKLGTAGGDGDEERRDPLP